MSSRIKGGQCSGRVVHGEVQLRQPDPLFQMLPLTLPNRPQSRVDRLLEPTLGLKCPGEGVVLVRLGRIPLQAIPGGSLGFFVPALPVVDVGKEPRGHAEFRPLFPGLLEHDLRRSVESVGNEVPGGSHHEVVVTVRESPRRVDRLEGLR